MTNHEVRSHIRKGEQAVEKLESMGFTYSAGHWHSAIKSLEDQMMDSILEPVVKALKELKGLREEKRVADTTIKAGDRFVITYLPPTMVGISRCYPDWKKRIFQASAVNGHNAYPERKVVRFGRSENTSHGLWIDVKFCQKVPTDAGF